MVKSFCIMNSPQASSLWHPPFHSHTRRGYHGNKESTVLAFLQTAAALQQTKPAPVTAFQECSIVYTSCRQVHVCVESWRGYF